MSDYPWDAPDWDDEPPLDLADLFPPDWDDEPPPLDMDATVPRPAPQWGDRIVPEGMDWDTFKAQMIPEESFGVVMTTDDPDLWADLDFALSATQEAMLERAEADFYRDLAGGNALTAEEYADLWGADLHLEDDLDLEALFAESCATVELDPTPSRSWEGALATLHLTPQSDIPLEITDPPLLHEESQTLIWFGVLQPDINNSEDCMMGVLAVHEVTAETPMQVDFARCSQGDYATCYAQAEMLYEVAAEYGLSTALETAHGLALENEQIQQWQDQQWGTRLPEPTAQAVRNTLEWDI